MTKADIEQFRLELQSISEKLDRLDVALRGDGNGTDKPGITQRVALLENSVSNLKRVTLAAGGVLATIITGMLKRLFGLPS